MGRYLLILAIAIMVTVLFWPHLRQLDPNYHHGPGARRKKGGQIFFALALCVGLSLFFSALLYLLALL